jgi:hypothetical protein
MQLPNPWNWYQENYRIRDEVGNRQGVQHGECVDTLCSNLLRGSGTPVCAEFASTCRKKCNRKAQIPCNHNKNHATDNYVSKTKEVSFVVYEYFPVEQ